MATIRLPPRRPPLMGFAALQSVVYNEVSGCLGYLIPPRRSSFPSRPRGLPLAAVPHGFRNGFILPCALRPSRVSRVTARPAEPSTSHGLSSLFATQTGGVHSRGRPRPASFRPRRFSRPRRLPPPPAQIHPPPPTKTDHAGHSAPTASEWGSMTQPTLVSFASLSAISVTL